jgi:hypothetical protein
VAKGEAVMPFGKLATQKQSNYKGGAMKKLDAKFNAVWNRIHEIQISQSNYVSQHQLNHVAAQIVELKKILVEAGILVEPTDLGSSVHQLDGKLYAVRKVK